MKSGIRDIQKSRALQACRLLIEAYQHAEEVGGRIELSDIEEAYKTARMVTNLK